MGSWLQCTSFLFYPIWDWLRQSGEGQYHGDVLLEFFPGPHQEEVELGSRILRTRERMTIPGVGRPSLRRQFGRLATGNGVTAGGLGVAKRAAARCLELATSNGVPARGRCLGGF